MLRAIRMWWMEERLGLCHTHKIPLNFIGRCKPCTYDKIDRQIDKSNKREAKTGALRVAYERLLKENS